MILSAQGITAYCKVVTHDPLITPFVKRTSVSVKDLQVDLSYGLSSCGYDIRLGVPLFVPPRTMRLGVSLEKFNIPNNLVMMIKDKSTLARRAIFVQNTVAEPGWRGYLTLEVSNDSYQELRLAEGTPIAQVMFMMLDQSTDQPYEGKYQDQGKVPQEAL